MTTPAFEAFLARLYVDAGLRDRFLADPSDEARRAGLGDEEVRALQHIDRDGLILTADSIAAKQRHRRPRTLVDRLLGRSRPL